MGPGASPGYDNQGFYHEAIHFAQDRPDRLCAFSDFDGPGGACLHQLPQAKWLTPVQMKAKIAKMGYRDIKVFQVSGSCYEIYAHTKDGKRAEVYFNPATGAVFQNNVD